MARAIPPHLQLAPVPQVPETVSATYEVKVGRNVVRQGPRQAEEQLIWSDPSIRGQMWAGTEEGELTSPAGHNRPYRRQSHAETVEQRQRSDLSNVGSRPSWTTQDGLLAGLAQGTSHDGEQRYEVDRVSGYRYGVPNEARIREA